MIDTSTLVCATQLAFGAARLDPQLALGAGAEPQAIAGGELAGDEFDGSVSLAVGVEGCSGVLVGPTIVLTAGHCLDELDADSPIAVYRGAETGDATLLQGLRWGRHPEACVSCGTSAYDLGYVELVEGFSPADGLATPVASDEEWHALMRPGTDVTVVGFGPSEEGGPSGTRRKLETRIDRLLDGGVEFAAGGNGGGTCKGDSGGPAFATTSTGARRLVGITSRGYHCGSESFFATPYPGLCWLRDETSLDLLPSECTDCDCIDLGDSGCGCDARADRDASLLGWSFTIAALRRRRARFAACRIK